jgi:hypothetical protein
MLLLDEYISRIESKEYLEYQEKLGEFFDYKEEIINKNPHNSYYKENKDLYEIYIDKRIFMKIWKPNYKNIFEKINELKEESNNIQFEYDILIKKNLFNPLQDELKLDTNLKFNNFLRKLLEIDNNIKLLYEYYLTVNNIEVKHTQILENINQLKIHNQELYNLILQEKDSFKRADNIKLYMNIIKTNSNNTIQKLNDYYFQLQTLNKIGYYIDFIIEKLPIIEILELTKEKKTEVKQQKVEEKVEKLEKKINTVLENQFKFKNNEECKSKKRSALYFMSKDDIIKVINNNEKMKAHMPKNYRTLKKEDICEILEQNKYITKK